MEMRVHANTLPDWCHLCGRRSDTLADIWYPENAEHGGANVEYIRICTDCGERIANISKS